jgi:hypothetical protein
VRACVRTGGRAGMQASVGVQARKPPKIGDTWPAASWASVECMGGSALGGGVGLAGCGVIFTPRLSRTAASGGASSPRHRTQSRSPDSPDSPFYGVPELERRARLVLGGLPAARLT